MVEQVEQRVCQNPGQWLVGGGFAAHDQIDAVAGKTKVYVPEPRSKKDEQGNEMAQDKDKPQPDDSEAGPAGVSAWPAPRPRSCTSSVQQRPNA